MGANENSSLYLFFGVAGFSLIWRIVRDKDWKNFQPANFQTSGIFIGIMSLISIAFFAALNTFKSDYLLGGAYFLGSFLLGFLLSELNLAAFSRSLILLMASVCLTQLVPHDHLLMPLSCTIAGLSVWKISSNLLRSDSATLLDFLPPVVWLSSAMWWLVANAGSTSDTCLAMVLGVLSMSIFLRWAQMPLLWEDPVYLKRIMLSLTGALMVLVIFTKLILAANFAKLAGVVGVGYLAAFLLDTLEKSKSEVKVQDSLTKLVLVGALTLLGSRLFGTEALLILSAAAVILARSGLAQVAGLFWALRVLQQCYTEQFNSNVTGININHEYVGAALYFGMAAAVAFAIVLRDSRLSSINVGSKLIAAVVPLTAFATAAGSSYLIHAEPTASFLVGVTVAAAIIGLSGQEIFGAEFSQYQNMILCPAVISGLALAASPLLELGNSATTHDRLVAVACLTGVMLLASIVCFFIGGGYGKKSSGDSSAVTPSTSG
ncbi:MAG TPA: hypothetical protein V6C86_08955 [Oculatellaceae cyanobacterium]